MNARRLIWCWSLLATLVQFAMASPAVAGNMTIEPGGRIETTVGLPISVAITIDYEDSYEVPVGPSSIDGVTVEGIQSGGTRSVTNIINGRMTVRRSAIYTFRVIPRRAGEFSLGTIQAQVDGVRLESDPLVIVAKRSETEDILMAEVVTPRERVYLGERLKLTLRILIQPFVDVRRNVRLSAGQMLEQVDVQGSTWGPFREALDTRPRAGTQAREDREGVLREYYVYEFDVTLWPTQTGTFSEESVSIVLGYPTAIRRDQAIFSRRDWAVSQTKPMIAVAPMPVVDVLSPPLEGRPPTFNGAVGQFDFDVHATPTTAAVGDPITLTMRVRDLTNGDSNLSRLQAPALDRMNDLTDQFRMPNDPLAGSVSGNIKEFKQTLRARTDGVSEIPSLPFVYFNPADESYEIAWSEPIPLEISHADTIGVADIVEAESGRESASTELSEVSGGILANYSDPSRVLNRAEQGPGLLWFSLVLAAPVLALGTAGVLARVDHLRAEGGPGRRRRAMRAARSRLRAASRDDGKARADAVASAVCGYVADRFGGSAEAITSGEALQLLRQHDVPEEIVADMASVLRECEASQYAGGGLRSDSPLVDHAERVLIDLRKRCGS